MTQRPGELMTPAKLSDEEAAARRLEILDAEGTVVLRCQGDKPAVAESIFRVIEERLMSRVPTSRD